MKKTSRKLLSLLMAFAIICSMAPAAFAAGNSWFTEDLWKLWQCQTRGHSWTYEYRDENRHNNVCSVCGEMNGTGYHNGSGYCTLCGYNYSGSTGTTYGHSHTYSKFNDSYHYVYCTSHPSCSAYYTNQLEAHFNNGAGYCACGQYVGGTISGSGSYVVQISQTALSLQVGGSSSLYVSPLYSNSSYSSVVWSSSNSSVATVSGSGNYAAVTGVAAGTATISAYVYSGSTLVDTVVCQVTVGSGYGTNGITITSSTGASQMEVGGYLALTASASYYLGGTVLTDAQLATLQWTSSNPSVASVGYYNGIYGSSSSASVGASVYVYGVSAGTATIYAQIPSTSYYATFDVTVGNASNANVSYSLTTGESLTLDSKSFENFWSEVTSGYGSLSYVVFGSATGSVGSLTYYRSSSTSATAVGSNPFYVSPSYSGQYGISSVTFTPYKATNSSYQTGTLAVPFTAYGTDSAYSYGYSTTSHSGTLYIMVTNGKVGDISYKAAGSSVSLVPSDFTSVYKTAMNTSSTYAPTVYIQFQNTPASGDLYYNYSANSYYGYGSGTKLTSSNIGSMRFASAASASYGIANVSYVPGSSKLSDTVTYVAYSSATGGTPLYVGKIVFTAGAEPKVEYYTPINTAVKFASGDFYANADLYYLEYISFGTPSSGTLYKNYANGTGTRVTSGTAFTMTGSGSSAVSSISTLTYVPAANYTGVVTIPFTGSNIMGGSVSGSVKIYVAKSFPDVAKGYSWASDYILRLTAEGVVGGNTDGTFAPGRDLSYGEALKMILEATGNSSTISKTGHWASNYLTKAYQKGIVSSKNIDLDSKITRDQVAELAAKALGISAASSVNTGITKPTDSTNGYVYALYNAGILNGTTTNGVNRYNGSKTINRAEISKIVCLVSDYYSANK